MEKERGCYHVITLESTTSGIPTGTVQWKYEDINDTKSTCFQDASRCLMNKLVSKYATFHLANINNTYHFENEPTLR